MKKKRWVVSTSLLVSLGLVGAACGGDNDSGSGATTAAPATSSAASTTTAGASTSAGATTTAAAAGAEGPVIPDKGSGKYGVDPNDENKYIGASGFELDLTQCP